jgi:hypothetical protein
MPITAINITNGASVTNSFEADVETNRSSAR